MTEPTTPLPESPYCRVRARVASIWADGPDAGTSPDWRPAVGEKVTLTPSIGAQLLVYDAAGPEPIIVTVERVQCEVDADGWLAKSDGRPVFIAPTDDPLLSATGWTWTATIKGKSVPFSAPAGGVVDLALFVATPAVDAVEYVSVVQIVADYITANPPDVATAVADYLTANPPAAAPDATTAAKGLIRLAGDLGGTADAPTVPGLADKADTGHGHAIGDVTGLQTALDGKQAAGSYAPATHNHDDRYYTESEVDAALAGKAPSTHNHDGTYAPANHNHDSTYATAAQGAKADTALQIATPQPINAQTGTDYTLVAADAGKLVTLTNAAAITLTVPGNVFTAGQRVDCIVAGAGMVTAVGSSCTVNGTPSLVSRAQWSAFTVLFTSATTAVLVGDLA